MSREKVKEKLKETDLGWMAGDDEAIEEVVDIIYDDFEAEIAKLKNVQQSVQAEPVEQSKTFSDSIDPKLNIKQSY